MTVVIYSTTLMPMIRKEDLRIVFMGTPDFAVGTLQHLVESGYNIVAVVTQPDKPVGRHQDTLQPTAVKQYALSCNIPVLQPEKMKDEAFLAALREYRADIQVVVAFRMLPEAVWAMPRFGTFNVHAALLPQYRGAAPINWAVINGEPETGVTTFFLDHDIDTGRIIEYRRFAIPDDADAEYVYNGLMSLGAEIADSTLTKILNGDGKVESVDQRECMNIAGVSSEEDLLHAPKIFKETCEIHWERTAKEIYDFVRGLSPYPGAWTTLQAEGERDLIMKIFRTEKTARSAEGYTPGSFVEERGTLYVATADRLLEIKELQITGKKRMTTRDFLNGFKKITAYSCLQHPVPCDIQQIHRQTRKNP